MKKMIMMTVLALAITSVSQATELCGQLLSHAVGPRCTVGIPCPHWIKLQFQIKTPTFQIVNVEAANESVLTAFDELNGQMVCADGQREGTSFTVDSIVAE